MIKEKALSQIGMRIPKTLKEKLEERAIENGRTLSNLIINILNDYINEIEKAKKLLDK